MTLSSPDEADSGAGAEVGFAVTPEGEEVSDEVVLVSVAVPQAIDINSAEAIPSITNLVATRDFNCNLFILILLILDSNVLSYSNGKLDDT